MHTYKGMRAVWWLILLAAITVLGSGLLQVYMMESGMREYQAMSLAQLLLIVPVLAGVVYLRLYNYESVGSLMGFRAFEPAMVFVLLVLPVATQYAASLVQMPITNRLVELFGQQTDMTCPKKVTDFLWLFVALCVVAPVMEELFFRGVIYKALEPYGMAVSILVSAFSFSLLHFQPTVFVCIFIVGIVLGFVRVYSGSVFACILFHSVFNFESLLQIVFGKVLSTVPLYMGVYVLIMLCLFPVLCLIGYLCWGRGKSYKAMSSVGLHGIVPMLLCMVLYGIMSAMLVMQNRIGGGF